MSDQINPVSAETCTAVPLESPERPVNASGTLSPDPQSLVGADGHRSTPSSSAAGAKSGGFIPAVDQGGPKPVHCRRKDEQAVTNNHGPEWSEADLETVARMLRAGDGAAAIGKVLNCSRVVVIGRVYRRPALKAIGFKTLNGQAIRKKNALTNYYAEPIAPRVKKAKAAPQHFNEPVLGDGVTLMDLKPHACKFPSGSGPIVFCCKARRVAGKPYCASHLSRAYRCEVA